MIHEDKLALAEIILRFIQDKTSSSEMPTMVGTLTVPYGIKGFEVAKEGHPVFEFKERYLIYLIRNDGKETVCIQFYKDSLKHCIDFTINKKK